MMKTPIALFVFNRPHLTKKVFNAIRAEAPQDLLLIADGPRVGKEDDKRNCAEVRRIIDYVDWPCRVLRNYSEENMGCKVRVTSGLEWVFENVEQSIILEDDCLPQRSFFKFTGSLLDKFRDDERVMMISGFNPLQEFYIDYGSDYFFSQAGSIWGWATWRRAWEMNLGDEVLSDVNKQNVDRYLNRPLGNVLYSYRRRHIEQLERGIDTWDFQWSLSRHLNSGLCVNPRLNLVRNIGFGKDATHTTSLRRNFSIGSLPNDLASNSVVVSDPFYDDNFHRSLSGRDVPRIGDGRDDYQNRQCRRFHPIGERILFGCGRILARVKGWHRKQAYGEGGKK